MTRRQLIVNYFSHVAATYAPQYDEHTPFGYAFRDRKRRLLELFNAPGGNVLDVGCGPGILVEDLVNRGCTVWGIDMTPHMIAQYRENFGAYPSVHCVIGTVEHLPFPDDFFDAIIAMGVLEFADDGYGAIREMIRVLRSHGTLLLTLPNAYSPYGIWQRFVFYPTVTLLRPLYYRLRKKAPDPMIVRLCNSFREYPMRAFLRDNRCEVADTVYFYFQVFPSPFEMLLPRFALMVAAALDALCRSWLRWLGAGFIVQAKKR